MARGGLPTAFPQKTHITEGKAGARGRQGREHYRQGQKMQAGGAHPPSLCGRVGQIGQNFGLVYCIQQVLGVHGQSVGGREHLPLALLTQGGHGVLLGQAHLIDELC